VYALAATALMLLTGAPPRWGAQPTWSGLDAGQVAQLESAIAAGLAVDPARRPATPGELVERLRAGWASTLPTGVMTFCMSDVEGSTMLWESHPAAMAVALVRHDELIARIVEAHGGRFLKSMGEGDSTTSVFESASRAVRAAIDATRALADQTSPDGEPIRARFGLHTGEAQRHGDVYLGPAVNLAARVRAEAAGGEVLLSEKTAALAGPDLPAGYAIVDLGPHHLKGIQRPERILALAGPGLETPPGAAECPYRGLLAFEEGDRHLFFGREHVVADVLGRIVPGRLLAVVGASGSGKSSLLRAGVIAAVRAGELACASSAVLITPGASPPLELGDDARELLVVDQFEELYAQCRDGARRTRFIAALLSRGGPVVIGLRADFYDQVSADAALAAAVASNQVLLGPMRDEDLRRAICEPARLSGLKLEPGLIDLVLRDVAGEPGALPLMSHALLRTWEGRDGRTLTVKAYQDSGGVSSALAQTADAVVDGTPEADRPLLRNVFLRLTEIGDDVEDTRRRVHIEELVPQGASPDTLRTLLERLSYARLVTLDQGTAEVAHEVLIRSWPTLRRWLDEDREGMRLHRRLSDAARLWDAAGREPADLYRGTRLDAVLEWAETNQELLNQTERDFLNASVDESARFHRRRLVANRRLRRALTAAAALLFAAVGLLAFALVSRHNAVQAEASVRSQALATKAESQIARDPQLALLLARAALEAAPTPEAQLAASEALDANTVRSQLPPIGIQGCADSNFLILLDRGRLAADDTCDGYVVFADLLRNRIVRRVHVGPSTTDMVLTGGGQTLLVAIGRNLVAVDARTGHVRHIFTAPFPIEQLAGGPPGRVLAIADREKIGIVDLSHGSVRVIAHGDASVNAVNGMMWASPDVLLVASTGQSQGQGDLFPGLTALDIVRGTRRTVSLVGPPDLAAVVFLRVSPDGRTWFITGAEVNAKHNNQTATTWAVDAQSRRVRWIARGPRGAFASPVQTSPDGRLVAVGYSTGAADVLDAGTGRLVVRDSSSSTTASGDLALAQGDDLLVTASLDGLLRTWATHGSEQLRLQAPSDTTVDFTLDGRDLVLIGNQGEIVDRRTGQTRRRFPGFPAGSVFNYCNSCFVASPQLHWLTYLDPSAASPRIVEIEGRTGRHVAAATVPRLDAQGVAPDGRIVATYDDGARLVARLIEPRSGTVRDLPSGPSNPGCIATTPSFTRDSRLMAIVDGCVHLTIWNLRTGHVARTIELPEQASGSGLLSPDGRYVLILVPGGSFLRADLTSGKVLKIPGTTAEGNALAISPNGRFYGIGRQDGTVDEYDARSLRLVRRHTVDNPIQSLVFSPDGRELAVEDTSNVVWVWDTCDICENPKHLAALAARESVRSLTPSERIAFRVG
jgi:class 3 adenylate cyclase/WD40 repeat protein/energy-coupling factor transporter ATP-binding protein EcfA2